MKTIQPVRCGIKCRDCYKLNLGNLRFIWLTSMQDLVSSGIATSTSTSDGRAEFSCSICNHSVFLCVKSKYLVDGEPMELQLFLDFAEKADSVLIDEHLEAFEAYVDFHSLDINLETLMHFDETFQGVWDSIGEFTREFIDDLGITEGVPDLLLNYIDYERLGKDLESDGCFESIDAPLHQIYVFCS